MTDLANELRRHACKLTYPQRETIGVMLLAADEIERLRSKIEAMEKQEPVASVWRCDNGHIHGSCERTLPMGTKLFALPAQKENDDDDVATD